MSPKENVVTHCEWSWALRCQFIRNKSLHFIIFLIEVVFNFEYEHHVSSFHVKLINIAHIPQYRECSCNSMFTLLEIEAS